MTLGQNHTSFLLKLAMLLLPHCPRLHSSEWTMIGSLHSRDESVDNMLHFDSEIFEVGSRHLKRKMHNYHSRSGRLVETTLNIDHCLSLSWSMLMRP